MEKINKEVLEKLQEKAYDFPVEFKKFDYVDFDHDTIELIQTPKYEVIYKECGMETIELPTENVLYKRNSVSGVYCRVY